MKRRDYDNAAKVRFKMKLTMRNTEGKDRKRKVHTRPIDVRLKSGADRNKFFKRIDEEWTGVYRKFTSRKLPKRYGRRCFEPRSEDE